MLRTCSARRLVVALGLHPSMTGRYRMRRPVHYRLIGRLPIPIDSIRASVLIALGAGFTGLAASAIALWANPSFGILAANLLLIAINAAVVVANLVFVRRLARTESAPKRERVC